MNIEKLIPQEVFDIGILNKEYHGRLLSDVNRLSDIAGIPVHYVWSRLSEHCEEADVAWVKKIKQGTGGGLCYVGNIKGSVENRLMAITGACLRNYVDARHMTLQDVLSRLKREDMPEPTVLLIPNFCLGKGSGGSIPDWQVSSLLGLLYTRLAHGCKTVIYIEAMETLEANYGLPFKKHIEANYQVL